MWPSAPGCPHLHPHFHCACWSGVAGARGFELHSRACCQMSIAGHPTITTFGAAAYGPPPHRQQQTPLSSPTAVSFTSAATQSLLPAANAAPQQHQAPRSPPSTRDQSSPFLCIHYIPPPAGYGAPQQHQQQQAPPPPGPRAPQPSLFMPSAPQPPQQAPPASPPTYAPQPKVLAPACCFLHVFGRCSVAESSSLSSRSAGPP